MKLKYYALWVCAMPCVIQMHAMQIQSKQWAVAAARAIVQRSGKKQHTEQLLRREDRCRIKRDISHLLTLGNNGIITITGSYKGQLLSGIIKNSALLFYKTVITSLLDTLLITPDEHNTLLSDTLYYGYDESNRFFYIHPSWIETIIRIDYLEAKQSART